MVSSFASTLLQYSFSLETGPGGTGTGNVRGKDDRKRSLSLPFSGEVKKNQDYESRIVVPVILCRITSVIILITLRDTNLHGMKEWIKDTAGLGIVLWLIGYIASLVLFSSPLAGVMGWIITAIFTPVMIVITWWWFRERDLHLGYYAGVGVVWTVIAIVFDYLFIVLLFQAPYYAPDVFLYYVLTFLIPVAVGVYLVRRCRGPQAERE